MERVGDEFLNDGFEGLSEISDDFVRLTVSIECSVEERSGRFKVAARGDEYVYDLAVFINGSVDVAPDTGDFDVGFVDEPASTNMVSTWSGSADE